MKNKILSAIAGVFIFSATFTACTKDPVKPTDEHNHDDPAKTVMTFYKGHYHGEELHIIDSTVVAIRQDGKFINPKTNEVLTETPVVSLQKSYNIYKLKINFFSDKGTLLNGEFIKEANIHQFFFIPKAGGEGVLSYEYKDADLGFDGDFNVLETGKTFDMDMVLMHGIDKSKNIKWNDPDFRKYGGSADFSTTLKIKTIEDDGKTGH